MNIYIVTSFGGVNISKDREYAIMAWYLCGSVEYHDAKKIHTVVGAPKGYSKKLADLISRDFSLCTPVTAPAKPDKFCSKINAMKQACDFAKEGDVICYLDADVMTYGSIISSIEKFKESNKMLLTETRPRQREEARKFRSWIVGTQVRENTAAFLDKWMHYAKTVKHKFSDQLALYKAWQDYGTSANDVMDYREADLKACHFGGYKFGSKDQSKSRGPFGKGHKGAMVELRNKIKKQPIF